MHRIVRIVRADPLVLRFDAGEQLHDQSLATELVAEKRRAIARIAVEGRGEILASPEQGAAIVVAAETADRADPPAGRVESLAEGVPRAQIAAYGVVARIEPGEDFGARILRCGRRERGQKQSGTEETDTRRLACKPQTICVLDATPKVDTFCAPSLPICCISRL
jgi:hypothetical protein